ncbi:sulfotransferase family protein [Sphingomonas alba]|uniref:Sulfotransferase n=1 Tax=Sphingomonas alba TaxID=2908208 RepID=A0ABT0RNE5_9SPHN|nr:sulfotransferase [Sphingomonas alba]MCL6684171.1 sulfotransferase [Sphingomonas alba]
MVSVSDFDRFVFVVGAPRCGTTTLAQFLRDNPAVNFPAVKEPHFFAQNDLRGLGDQELKERVERDYLNRFFSRRPHRRVGVDASVTYLYMPEQLEPILRLWPDARFVIALRNPLSMLPSLHRRLIYIGDETISDFADAWAAAPDRAAGRRIPARCADPRWLRYDEAGRFASYLERLFAVVGRKRCHVVLFDELELNPAGEYRRLMAFCGLEPVIGTDFSPRRASRDVRYVWLQRLLKRPPIAIRNYFAGEQFMQRVRDLDDETQGKPAKAVLSLRKRLLRWNRVPARRQILSDEMREEIRARFEGEILRLQELLDRDLSNWLIDDECGQSKAESASIAAE